MDAVLLKNNDFDWVAILTFGRGSRAMTPKGLRSMLETTVNFKKEKSHSVLLSSTLTKNRLI